MPLVPIVLPNELTPAEALALLQAPYLIWAPDGTTFTARLLLTLGVTTLAQVRDSDFSLSQFELEGPGDQTHRWLSSLDGEFVANSLDDDVPHSWTVKAKVALHGWLQLSEELAT